MRRGALGFLKLPSSSFQKSSAFVSRLRQGAWISWDSPSEHLHTPAAGVWTQSRTRFNPRSSPVLSSRSLPFLGGSRGLGSPKPPSQIPFGTISCGPGTLFGAEEGAKSRVPPPEPAHPGRGGRNRPPVFPLQLESSPRWGYLFSLPPLFFFLFSRLLLSFQLNPVPLERL